MKFVIHNTALNEDEASQALLDRVVDRIADEIHVAALADPDMFEQSLWCQSARQTRRRVLVSAASRPPRSGSGQLHRKEFEVKDAMDIQRACRIAYTPLTVLVEDREADGVLLDILIMKVASPDLQAFWAIAKSVTPRGLDIDTSGGVDAMPQRIRRALDDSKVQGGIPRIFALCDSDARWPEDDKNPSHTSIEKILEICDAENIQAHVLRKRNAENYIPDSVFLAAKELPENRANAQIFDAFFRRSPIQRNHFPVKDGMSEVEREMVLRQGLYSQHEVEDLQRLKVRVMPKRPRLLLRVFDEYLDAITKESLEARDGCGEIRELIEKLQMEL